jgi:hypothetical protein
MTASWFQVPGALFPHSGDRIEVEFDLSPDIVAVLRMRLSHVAGHLEVTGVTATGAIIARPACSTKPVVIHLVVFQSFGQAELAPFAMTMANAG